MFVRSLACVVAVSLVSSAGVLAGPPVAGDHNDATSVKAGPNHKHHKKALKHHKHHKGVQPGQPSQTGQPTNS